MKKLIFGLLLLPLFFFHVQAGTKVALLIGVEDYPGPGLESLEGPGNDLELVSEVLIQRFQFKKENITLLMNQNATHNRVREAFAQLTKKCRKGDFVYIHYSGHGSLVKDKDGDESPGEYDQSWVTYGSRSKKAKGDDRFDIIDDQMYTWLSHLQAKTGDVVFVSDSCYSGTIYRTGLGPIAKCAPSDERDYPAQPKILRNELFKEGIRIGAADDAGKAYEDRLGKKVYSVFTWFWAQALQQARPGDTWNDLFKQVKAKVRNKIDVQNPQIHGKKERFVFGGQFKKAPPRIAVSQTWDGGRALRLEVGRLSGITEGSIYGLHKRGNTTNSTRAKLEITSVEPFHSDASALEGTFRTGDLVIEERHAFNLEPIRVFIDAGFPDGVDKELVERLRGLFNEERPELSAYRLVSNGKYCDMLLYVLRPEKENGKRIPMASKGPLRKSFPHESPRVWVLNRAKEVILGDNDIPFDVTKKGLESLAGGLFGLARIEELKNLASGNESPIQMRTTVWRRVEKPLREGKAFFCLPENKGWVKKQAEFEHGEMDGDVVFPLGWVLTFHLDNPTDADYYFYIIDMMDNGKVNVIFPSPGDPEEETRLAAGADRDLKDTVLLFMSERGLETVKLIVSEEPINIFLLVQGLVRSGLKWEKWGTLQFTFGVN